MGSSREFIVISGTDKWCEAQAQNITHKLSKQNCIWISNEEVKSSIAKQKHQVLLGGTLTAVIYQAHTDFNPDTLLMLSGCIEDQGALILLTPPLEEWVQQSSPSYHALLSYGIRPNTKQNFLTWFCKQLQSDTHVKLINENNLSAVNLPVLSNPHKKPFKITSCQKKAREAIKKCYLSEHHYPLIIIGPRGRGKSAVLGYTAKELTKQYNANIIITALHASSTQSIQTHSSPHQLIFFAPDYLLSTRIMCDVLLIDEAAAMPTALLYQLIKHYPKVILTSTTDGYEGTALNFLYKTIPHLKNSNTNTQIINMTTGIRFQTPCALENFMNHTFFLMPNHKETFSFDTGPNKKLSFSILDPQTLRSSQKQLTQIYTLLKSAHYRTALNDLRLLMDTPNLLLVIIKHNNNIIGVLQAVPEGNLPAPLAKKIMLGTRRVQGHLIAQSLGLHLHHESVMTKKSYRILRICIEPRWQKKSLGSQLIQYACNELIKKNVDFISVSFGANENLLAFWQRNKFDTVRLGYRFGTSTGLHSIFMIKVLAPSGAALISSLKKTWSQQIFTYLKLMPNPWPTFLHTSYNVITPSHSLSNSTFLWNFINHRIPLITALHQIIPVLKKYQTTLNNNKQYAPLNNLLIAYNKNNPSEKSNWPSQYKTIRALLKDFLIRIS